MSERWTISMPVGGRPEYLRRTLESIRANDRSGFRLVATLEPGLTRCRELVAAADFMPKTVLENERLLGLNANTFRSCAEAFALGSEFTLYLESDVELAPDALDLCRWFVAQKEALHSACVGLILFNWDSRPRPEEVLLGRMWATWGIGITRLAWEKHFRDNWGWPEKPGLWWDNRMDDYVKADPALRTLTPRLSRARHIGVDGGHSKVQEWRRKQIFEGLVNETKGPFGYRLVG